MANVADEIDALYGLPLDEFTPARNALAKRLGRTEPPIKSLQKPSVPAWAVNQLYWHQRATYDRLIHAAARLRSEHRKLLAGKAAEIRDTEKVHREAVRGAIDQVREILANGNQALSPATMMAVGETLEALPSPEPAGRLTKPLRPTGFEALAGVSARPPAPALRIVRRTDRERPAAKQDPEQAAAEARRAATEARREAEAVKRAAEVASREAAREAAREKERQRAAQAALRQAESAVQRAEAAFQKAEAETTRRADELREARDALRRLRRTT